jgi:hypothetical protein
MKVIALRVEVNGELVAIAGAENLSLLSGTVGLGSGSTTAFDSTNIMFSVMGLDVGSRQPRQLTWAEGVQLKLGDKVSFQVVEVEHPSPPSKVLGSPNTKELAAAAEAEKSQPRGKRRGA